ncbi:MAG: PepSY-associated TM helix domain-containing protein, partial [Bacteroidota bacterium]
MKKRKEKQWTVKKILHQLHLYLGLATGLVVFIMALTGCGWVFQEEITGLYDDYKAVIPADEPMITVTQATEIAKTVFADKHIHGTLFGAADEAIEVIFYQPEPEFYQSVFLNPYSGEVLHVKDHFSGFFHWMIDGHVNLWLPNEIGSQITAYSTLIFLFILISGLVLWWPKKRKNLQQRLQFDWKATTSWKRKNWDLHAITGFYTFSLALLLGFTGCIMAFNWMYYLTYKAAGGQKDPRFVIPANEPTAQLVNSSTTLPIDQLIPKLKTEYPEALSFELHTPDT